MIRREYLGSGDGGCVIERPKGAHTNGGCKCLQELPPAKRIRVRKRLIDFAKLLHELDEHADMIRESYRNDPGPECCASTATVLVDSLDGVTGRKERKR